MSEHFLKITKKDRSHLVGEHFSKQDHDGLDHVTLHVLDFIHAAPETIQAKKTQRQNRIKLDPYP